MFDWENAITLHAMHGNRASSRGEVEVSWVFSSRFRNWGIFSSDGGDVHSKLEFFSANSGHLSPYDGKIRNVN